MKKIIDRVQLITSLLLLSACLSTMAGMAYEMAGFDGEMWITYSMFVFFSLLPVLGLSLIMRGLGNGN